MLGCMTWDRFRERIICHFFSFFIYFANLRRPAPLGSWAGKLILAPGKLNSWCRYKGTLSSLVQISCGVRVPGPGSGIPGPGCGCPGVQKERFMIRNTVSGTGSWYDHESAVKSCEETFIFKKWVLCNRPVD